MPALLRAPGTAADLSNRMTVIALRPTTAADSEFCFRLHKAAMGEYVTAIWGWDEQRQRDFHARGFAPGNWQIITVDGTDAGILIVDYRPAEIYLARFEIHPDYQGHGVGTRVIRALIDEPTRSCQDLGTALRLSNHAEHAL